MAKLTKKTLKDFPEVMFIAKKEEGDTEWFNANEEAADCMDDDGPQVVAHYKLVGVYELRKTVRTVQSINANGKKI